MERTTTKEVGRILERLPSLFLLRNGVEEKGFLNHPTVIKAK